MRTRKNELIRVSGGGRCRQAEAGGGRWRQVEASPPILTGPGTPGTAGGRDSIVPGAYGGCGGDGSSDGLGGGDSTVTTGGGEGRMTVGGGGDTTR
eukprot:7675118-Pyramimonas_sp.AAC.1